MARRKIGHCESGVKIPQEEADDEVPQFAQEEDDDEVAQFAQEEDDDEVVLVGVVINTNTQRPTTPPPETPVCVIVQVWGNHVDGMVAPPAASPAASPGVPPMEPQNSPSLNT